MAGYFIFCCLYKVMIELNTVVLNVIACLQNKHVLNKIEESYELKIVKLPNYELYLNSEELYKKVITKDNFKACVNFVIKQLSDDKFRTYVERSAIFCVAFYPKQVNSNNKEEDVFDDKSNVLLCSLRKIVKKYNIDNDKLIIFVNPIKVHKATIIKNELQILEAFKSKGYIINSIEIRYIHNEKELDSLGEALIDIGYAISKS